MYNRPPTTQWQPQNGLNSQFSNPSSQISPFQTTNTNQAPYSQQIQNRPNSSSAFTPSSSYSQPYSNPFATNTVQTTLPFGQTTSQTAMSGGYGSNSAYGNPSSQSRIPTYGSASYGSTSTKTITICGKKCATEYDSGVTTNILNITAIPEYSTKSIEELRFEAYRTSKGNPPQQYQGVNTYGSSNPFQTTSSVAMPSSSLSNPTTSTGFYAGNSATNPFNNNQNS